MKTLEYTPRILTLISAGKKLEAVKMAKDLYGLSLHEAKEMIDSYRPGGLSFYTTFELNTKSDYTPEITKLINEGKISEAVRKAKSTYGISEENAKKMIDNYPQSKTIKKPIESTTPIRQESLQLTKAQQGPANTNNIFEESHGKYQNKFTPKPGSVSMAYFQKTPKTIDYSKCPFCGSSNFGQSNKASNFVLSRGIALGFKALTGMSGSASNLEDSFDRVYQCDNCHRKWTSWENPMDLPSDQWNLNKTIEDITNNVWKFETNEQVMRFSWHIDMIINNDDAYTPSNSIKARFYFLKQFACMQYIINTYKRDFDYERDFEYYVDLDMHYRAGLTFAQYSLELDNYGENLLCFLITSYITQTIGDTSKDDLEEALSKCVIPNDTSSFIFQRDYWEGIIKWINCLKK